MTTARLTMCCSVKFLLQQTHGHSYYYRVTFDRQPHDSEQCATVGVLRELLNCSGGNNDMRDERLHIVRKMADNV